MIRAGLVLLAWALGGLGLVLLAASFTTVLVIGALGGALVIAARAIHRFDPFARRADLAASRAVPAAGACPARVGRPAATGEAGRFVADDRASPVVVPFERRLR